MAQGPERLRRPRPAGPAARRHGSVSRTGAPPRRDRRPPERPPRPAGRRSARRGPARDRAVGHPSVGLSSLTERHFAEAPEGRAALGPGRPARSRAASKQLCGVRRAPPDPARRVAKELRKAKRMRWAEEEFQTLTRREWPGRQFDEQGYCASRARRLDPEQLSILRALYLMRDARADRPPFKVLGTVRCSTSPSASRARPRPDRDQGLPICWCAGLGGEVMAAVKEGSREHHGRIPSGRRRGPGGRAPARRAQDWRF